MMRNYEIQSEMKYNKIFFLIFILLRKMSLHFTVLVLVNEFLFFIISFLFNKSTLGC